MKIKGFIISLVVVGLSMSHGSLGQSGGCTTALISLSPCLAYITATGSSGSTTPSSSCCSRLATVVQSQPLCLCSALNGRAAASLGVTINQTRALALPAACRLQTPPPSRCNDNDSEGGVPTISPMNPPDNNLVDQSPVSWSNDEEVGPTAATSSEANLPSTIGSGNVPITGGISSDNSPFYHLITIAMLLIPMVP